MKYIHGSSFAAFGFVLGVSFFPVAAQAGGLLDVMRTVTGVRTTVDEANGTLAGIQSIADAVGVNRSDDLAVDKQRVVMYSTTWCGYCKQARSYMKERGIPFVERDIERDPTANAEHKRLGGRGVPLLLVGQQQMNGFSTAKFQRMVDEEFNKTNTQAMVQPQPTGASQQQGSPASQGAGFASGAVLTAKIKGVKLYSAPDAGSRVIAKLNKGDEFVTTGEKQGVMVKVHGAQGEGWVESVLVKAN